MIVLGLDTATFVAGIAIVDDERTLIEVRHDTSNRSNDLLVAIDRACKDAGIGPRDLDAIAVGAGPGSFTGLRIGMATAKGIAFAAGRPLWAVSSLAALARAGTGDLRCAALDARKGEVFAGVYLGGRLLGVEACVAPSALVDWATSQLAGELPQGGASTYIGDAQKAHPEALGAIEIVEATPSGVAVARCALEGARVDVLVDGKPAYIRPAEAEVMYPEGVPGALRRR